MKKIMQQLIHKSAICLSIVSLIGMNHVSANNVHVVEKGDTIYSLSRKYGLSEQALMDLNGLTNAQITVGDRLLVSLEAAEDNDNQSSDAYYIVQKGDTLYSIANRYGLTVDQLRAMNGLSGNYIDVGDVLALNGPVQPQQPPVESENASVYVVQKGDSLYQIANRFGLTVDQLRAMNGIQGNFIDVGDRLVLSGSNQGDQPPTGGNNQATYVVQKGDSLYKIAKAYGLTVKQLMAMNGLTSDFLDVGDLLAVGEGGTTSVTPGPSSPSGSNQGSYIVRKGDSLYTIALAYGVTIDQLITWNGLVSDLIYPGDQLAVTANGTTNVTQPSRPSGQYSTNAHTVVPGDNFDDLARPYGMTGRQLMAFNGRSDTMIYPGEVIYLPESGSAYTPSVPAQPNTGSNTNHSSNQTGNDGTIGNTEQTTPPAVNHEKPQSPVKKPREVNIRKPKSLVKDKQELTDPSTKALDPYTIDLPTHEVAEGEDLAGIAKSNQVDEKDLRAWNGLLNDGIKVGDVLFLKDPSQAITSFKQMRPLKEVYPIKYVLQKDEKVRDLLEIYPVTEAEIIKWSDLKEGSAIEEGQELLLTFPDKTPQIHTVEEEDSLASIAQEYDVTVEALREWNGLLDNVVYIGEELAVTNPWVEYHQVAPGETLEVLADQYEVSIDQLREWNQLPAESMVVNGTLIVSDPKAFEQDEEDENETQTTSSEDQQETSAE